MHIFFTIFTTNLLCMIVYLALPTSFCLLDCTLLVTLLVTFQDICAGVGSPELWPQMM